jgi:hypothetical protein
VRGFGGFRAAALTLAVSVALGACLPGSARAAGTVKAWSHTDLGAITQPAPVGGRFVFYAQRNRSLDVIALNALDGSLTWRAPATASDVTAGVAAALAVRSGVVFYLEPAGASSSGIAQVVARGAG